MKKKIFSISLAIVITLAMAIPTMAMEHNLTFPSAAAQEVQSQLNAALPGDIVRLSINSGTFVPANPLNVPDGVTFIIDGAGELNAKGITFDIYGVWILRCALADSNGNTRVNLHGENKFYAEQGKNTGNGLNTPNLFPPNTYLISYLPGEHGAFAAQNNFKEMNEQTPGFAGTPAGESGWKFVGWDPVPSEFVIGDAVYTAQWERDEFTVTFYVDGDVYDTQTVTCGDAAMDPAPMKTGYTFSGWDKAFDNITGDIDVYGSFSVNFYTVTFMANGVEFDSQSVAYKNAANDPGVPVKAGYAFTEWDKAFDNITGDLTVTALWSVAIDYSITYNLDGGTNAATNPVSYTIEDTPISIADAGKDGYKFMGWTEGNEIAEGSFGDKAFTANWEKIKVSFVEIISYNKNLQDKNNQNLVFVVKISLSDGTFLMAEHAEKVNGQQKGSKIFTYESLYGQYSVYVAWNDNNTVTACEFRAVDGNSIPSANQIPGKFTVVFMVDGIVYDTQQIDSGKAAKSPKNPTPPKGYTFSGWDVKFDKVMGDLTINAVWKKNQSGNQQ